MKFRRIAIDVDVTRWEPADGADGRIESGGNVQVARPGDYIVTEPGRGPQVYRPRIFESNFVPLTPRP